MDWRKGTVEETSWDGLMLHAVKRTPANDPGDTG